MGEYTHTTSYHNSLTHIITYGVPVVIAVCWVLVPHSTFWGGGLLGVVQPPRPRAAGSGHHPGARSVCARQYGQRWHLCDMATPLR